MGEESKKGFKEGVCITIRNNKQYEIDVSCMLHAKIIVQMLIIEIRRCYLG